MGKVCILAEKPSAARNFAKALGGKSGTYKGQDYVIVPARGHLFEFKDPTEMVPADKKDKYTSWELGELPWDEKDFSWEREMKKGASQTLGDIRSAMGSCSEVCHGADLDPTGEGDLLGWEIIDALDAHDKKLTRMEFIDESPASIQKAFENRRTMTSMMDEGNYRKAEFRSRFDMMSMQWTRVATKILATTGRRAVLRNGRLKSAMVVIVGDGLKAHNDYVKKPVYMARFTDDLGVTYTNPEAEEFSDASQVDLSGLATSSVTKDKVTPKSTAPPKLLDLSGLSSMLSKKGVSAKEVLSVYQKMYEAQIVSYPRTEDRTVTNEQFKDLVADADKIARVVGIDPAKLTHRSPRKSHVKDSGAHGANRPGPNVPGSLEEVEQTYGRTGRMIYETLAKNSMTMLAEDYRYDQHAGHVTDFPDFTGTANVPTDQGWKDIFTVDADLADDGDDADSAGQGLGSTAEPVVGERVNPRPPHPNQGWLMKQLEKRSVGTGATRTSTYAEVTGGKNALMKEAKSKLTLTETGEVNHLLLPGTRIGDLALTERVYADMDRVSKDGSLDFNEMLQPVKDWIVADIETMRNNAVNITENVGTKLTAGFATKEKATGVWAKTGEPVKFTREFRGHRFTDDEVVRLLAGETDMVIECVSQKTGNPYEMVGGLDEDSFTADDGKVIEYVGFQGELKPREVDTTKYAVGTWVPQNREIKFKRSWVGHEFTDKEIADLLGGDKVTFDHDGKQVTGQLADKEFTTPEGKTVAYVGFEQEVDESVYKVGVWVKTGKKVKFKRRWSTHDFTDAELDKLLAGEEISFEATSKRTGKSYTAKGSLENCTFETDGKVVKYIGFKPDFGDGKSGGKGGSAKKKNSRF